MKEFLTNLKIQQHAPMAVVLCSSVFKLQGLSVQGTFVLKINLPG